MTKKERINMTKKERILEILSRKEAATPLKDRLLDAASQTEALARSREGVSSIAGGIGGGLLGAILSRGSRKKRIRDILLGAGIGVAGGYAAGKYITPGTSAAKEEYDPVVDGANPTITGQQEPAEDNSSREEKAAQQKAQQKAPAITGQQEPAEDNSSREEQAAQQAAQQKELDRIKKKFSPEAQMTYSRQPTLEGIIEYNRVRREQAAQQAAQQKAAALRARQEAGQRMSEALAKQGRRQAIIGGLTEFGTQLNDPRGYDEFLGNVGGAVSAGASRAAGVAKNTAGELVSSVQDIGRGAADLGPLAADAMKEKRDVATGKKLPADVQAEYDRLLKGR